MATYYWVGGSGNWDATSTANWSDTSGGASGFGPPTSVDDVIFDAGSNVGTGAFAVTVTGTSSAPAVCRDFSTGGAGGALDGAMTLTMGATAQLDCYGSLTTPAANFAVSATAGAIIAFKAAITGKTITTNNVNFSNIALTFDGIGGEWSLGSAYTSTAGYVVTNGSFLTSNFNVTISSLTSNNSNVRSISLGSSTVTLAAGTPINFTTSTNLILNAGTSTITCSGANPIFNGGGLTFYNVSFTTTGASSKTITGENTFNNFTVASTTGTRETFTFFGANQTINGTLTFGAANQPIRRIRITSNVIGQPRTLTVASVAALADVDFRDIVAAGASAPWSGTRIGDSQGNSGITFDAGVNKFWNLAAGGNWSSTAWALSSGGAVNINNFPLPQDTVIIEDTGLTAGNTITVNSNWQIGTIDASSRTAAATLVLTSNIYKDVILSSAITVSGVSTVNISGQGTQSITSAGRTITNPVNIEGISVVSCTDALSVSNTVTFRSGTLRLKDGATSTVTTFTTSGSVQKTLESTLAGSQATLSQASGTVNATFLTIKDINATGGATWNAFVDQGNIDAGNNDGWDFGISPIVGGNEYTYQLRSFTQPRRF